MPGPPRIVSFPGPPRMSSPGVSTIVAAAPKQATAARAGAVEKYPPPSSRAAAPATLVTRIAMLTSSRTSRKRSRFGRSRALRRFSSRTAPVGVVDPVVLHPDADVVVNAEPPPALVTPLLFNARFDPDAGLVLHQHVGHGRPLVGRLDP